MEVNLSMEMIEKITKVAFGRIHDLKQKRSETEERLAVGDCNIRRKHLLLKEIDRAIEDAEDVHELFLSMQGECQC